MTAGFLIVAKLIAWYVTGSVGLLASLVDSVMDSIASLINLFAIRYSLQPADEQHRFGVEQRKTLIKKSKQQKTRQHPVPECHLLANW